ncbi:MAG TPA: macro domain-containing protein [Gemmatimonadales bacterium]|nr:macro domain-containing protein [Gemmatimonadales bacterium]
MIRAVAGDLASMVADAVVRPANPELEPLMPALRSLDAVAGPRFVEQRRLRNQLGVGAAVVTGGGELPAEFVIHVVVGTDEDAVTADTIRRAYEAALWQCTQWAIETIATPVPAAGNIAPSLAFQTVLSVIREHLRNAEHPATVLIVVPEQSEADSLNARIGQGD